MAGVARPPPPLHSVDAPAPQRGSGEGRSVGPPSQQHPGRALPEMDRAAVEARVAALDYEIYMLEQERDRLLRQLAGVPRDTPKPAA